MPVNDDFTVDDVRHFFSGWVAHIREKHGISAQIGVDESVAYDVLYHYVQDRQRMSLRNSIPQPDGYKCMSCLAFWIRKLKPFYYVDSYDPEISIYLNELFGLMIAIISCEYQHAYHIKLNDVFLADTLQQFRYKSVSPHSLYIILKAMFTEFKCSGSDFFQ